jgi:hypothetical protein
VAPHSRGIDRPYITADGSSGPYRGRVYVNAHLTAERSDSGARAPRALALYRSLDHGATIEAPVLLPMPDVRLHTTPGEVVVLSDGTVVALYSEYRTCVNESGGSVRCTDGRPSIIRAYWSTDGGATLSKPVAVGRTTADPMPMVLAVDRSNGPFRDRLYAAWIDSIPGSRATRLMLTFSADKGKTWSPARAASDNVPFEPPLKGPSVTRPALAVNRAGVIGLAWYDERESAGHEHLSGELGYHFRFAASLDGGETFTPSVRVSTFPARDQRAEALHAVTLPPLRELESVDSWISILPFWVGHTSGLAADASGVFHPAWIDGRTGYAQLWTAPVRVAGNAYPNGSRELALLTDLSRDAAIELSGINWDRASGALTAELRVRNRSDRRLAIRALRVIGIAAGVGTPAVLNADNGIEGPGAVWTLAAELAPGQVSSPRSLRFSLSNLHQATGGRVGSGFVGDLLHLDARVLGLRR